MTTSTVSSCALLGTIALIGLGCGSGDNDNGSTRTATPTPSHTVVVPTATPTPQESPHTENIFGSTAAGSGSLTVDAAAEVEVFFSACLGGSGDQCDGGILIYSGTVPGFEEAEEDEPDEPLFVLVDDIAVTLEVTQIDPGVSLKIEDLTLSAPGDFVQLGVTPGIHQDLEWQLQLPAASPQDGRSVSLRLTTTSPQYEPSEEFTVTLQPTSGQPGE